MDKYEAFFFNLKEI